MAEGEADGLVAEGVAGSARHAGLARAGLTGDDGVLAFLDALDEVTDDTHLCWVEARARSGLWHAKAATLTADQKIELANAVDELASYFDREFWASS